MQIFYFILFTLLSISFFSCNNEEQKTDKNTDNKQVEVFYDSSKVEYAEFFTLKYFKNYKIIQLNNSAKTTYLLYPKENKEPKTSGDTICIPIPVRDVVCLSTTHVAFMEAIQEIDKIIGVADVKKINSQLIRERINKKYVQNIGIDEQLNVEKILKLQPRVLFTYDIGTGYTGLIHTLEKAGVKVVYVGEYKENTPLAKCEWIKFIAAFFNKELMANEMFLKSSIKYLELKDEVKNINNKPKILVNTPWKGTWYSPGGNSYIAKYINDAGGDYLFKNDTAKLSIAMSIEEVVYKGKNADIWINAGGFKTLNEIKESDNRLSLMKAFNNKTVYNNNKIVSVGGGSDFWESGTVFPEKILSDLINIFHPNVSIDTNLYYYHKLQ